MTSLFPIDLFSSAVSMSEKQQVFYWCLITDYDYMT